MVASYQPRVWGLKIGSSLKVGLMSGRSFFFENLKMDHVKSLVLKHSCGDLICLNEFGSNSLEKVRVWLRTCSVSQQAAVIQEFPTGCEVFLNDHFQHAKH